MKNFIFPSIMCADLMNVETHLRQLENCDVEYIHVDIMDGSFVNNYTLGTDFIKQLHHLTHIPLDIHLMINHPEEKLQYFEFSPNDIVSVHAESTCHLQGALTQIHAMGAKAAVAVNPATSLSCLDYVYDDLDMVLIMTVNPGFAGQKMIPSTLNKIHTLRAELKKLDREDILIEVDGNVSFENAKKMAQDGANVFVAGTSSIYAKNTSLVESLQKLRACVNEASYDFA